MKNSDTSSITFLTLPESFQKKIQIYSGKNTFTFDPSIPLPVEIYGSVHTFNIEDLTLEMLMSGMLKVIAEGKTAEHIFYYRNFVLAVRPDILKELGGAAITKSKNGDYTLAREIIALLKALFPASAEVLFLAAVLLEEEAGALRSAGNEAEADVLDKQTANAYNEALAVESPLPDALFNAAFFYMKQHDYAKAREYFREYIEVSNDEFKKTAALKEIRIIEARQLDDEHFGNAFKLISAGNEEAGMLEVRQFLEKRPDVWNGWFMLGWALRRLGRWQDGAAAFRKAIELGGDNYESRNELAICLIELGDLPAAKRELETALEQESENVKIISNLGIVHLKMGNRETAEAFFRTVLELEPDDPLAKKFLLE